MLDGRIEPGKVFDLVLLLADVAEGYRAMDERRAIRSYCSRNRLSLHYFQGVLMFDFDGKVALVTGTGSGLGLATAEAFAAAGASVALADVDDAAVGAAAEN